MSLPSSLRRFFGKSAERPSSSSPTPATQVRDSAFATHKRMTVGSRGVLADTKSMEPQYTAGDTFTVRACDFNNLQPGFVVVAWWSGRKINVPHRIISSQKFAANGEPYYIVKGDGNAIRDSNLTRDSYIGICQFDKDQPFA